MLVDFSAASRSDGANDSAREIASIRTLQSALRKRGDSVTISIHAARKGGNGDSSRLAAANRGLVKRKQLRQQQN